MMMKVHQLQQEKKLVKSVIFLAPPAAGKGTYSKFLEDKYGYYGQVVDSIMKVGEIK